MAKNKPPVPVCTSFLVVRSFRKETGTDDTVFIGLPRAFWTDNYPAAARLSFFVRCMSGHGKYPLEVQLQSLGGEVVWKEAPTEPWAMMDPLETYDMQMNLLPIFPAPGVFQFVLVLDGEEVSRQRFHAMLGKPPTVMNRGE
jgi:hypothetical protein